jgi:hypothetical protein
MNIQQAKGFEVSRAQGLTPASCNSFHTNLQALYNQHNYIIHHVWNSNET